MPNSRSATELQPSKELPSEEFIPSPDPELIRDERFMMCVSSTCGEAWARGQDTMPYNKNGVAQAIVPIIEKWDIFPPTLTLAMEAIYNLSFMKPPLRTENRSLIINIAFYATYKMTERGEDGMEEVKEMFLLMLKGLLAEAPTVGTLSSIVEDLSFYVSARENGEENDLAASSLQWLLAHSVTLPSLNLESVKRLVPPELSWMCPRAKEELQMEDLE
ncbi:uncharacterized protein LOC133371380 isoform X2 [Rhineura floridana]|uniref:uncharacterized protein LOC133371380 isoform X2 n=1 Tax=Rhineura floridana TaxID=261503 RepID=UPI002AC84D49|nr:uncharacterized protein LOC133371380 isoform X2 [Rhineura floridana]